MLPEKQGTATVLASAPSHLLVEEIRRRLKDGAAVDLMPLSFAMDSSEEGETAARLDGREVIEAELSIAADYIRWGNLDEALIQIERFAPVLSGLADLVRKEARE